MSECKGIRTRTDAATDSINRAKEINDAMQAKHKVGTPEWHQHEELDDRLHDALGALGD